jgi:bifunctional DNA-binding transcriptional regulator/antitoxin component of YhaV-PrlF toxin-antitoxin module
VIDVGNISDRERLERLKSVIWTCSKIDYKGRVLLPKQLREKLGVVNGRSKILWIQCNRKKDEKNEYKNDEFLIEVGVKP